MALSTVDREIFVCGSLRVLNFRLIFFARTHRRKFNAPKINSRRARVLIRLRGYTEQNELVCYLERLNNRLGWDGTRERFTSVCKTMDR